jgi:hypothetical protein
MHVVVVLGHTGFADTDFVQVGGDTRYPVAYFHRRRVVVVDMVIDFDLGKENCSDFGRMVVLVDQMTVNLDLDRMTAEKVHCPGDEVAVVGRQIVDLIVNQSDLQVYTLLVVLRPYMDRSVLCANIQNSAAGRGDHVQGFHRQYLQGAHLHCLIVQIHLLSTQSHHTVAVAEACYHHQEFQKPVDPRNHQTQTNHYFQVCFHLAGQMLIGLPNCYFVCCQKILRSC